MIQVAEPSEGGNSFGTLLLRGSNLSVGLSLHNCSVKREIPFRSRFCLQTYLFYFRITPSGAIQYFINLCWLLTLRASEILPATSHSNQPPPQPPEPHVFTATQRNKDGHIIFPFLLCFWCKFWLAVPIRGRYSWEKEEMMIIILILRKMWVSIYISKL